jgi:copper oxidase (laccase) domain-containing protein
MEQIMKKDKRTNFSSTLSRRHKTKMKLNRNKKINNNNKEAKHNRKRIKNRMNLKQQIINKFKKKVS